MYIMYLSVVSSHQLLAKIFFWFCQIELRDTWIKLNDDVLNEKMFLLKYQIWKCSLNLYNYWKELTNIHPSAFLLFFCLKAGPFSLFCRLRFLGVLEQRRLPKLSTNHNGVLPGCNVHFDWLKFWKVGAPVLPKTLQISNLIC